jgi:hypothetical protein
MMSAVLARSETQGFVLYPLSRAAPACLRIEKDGGSLPGLIPFETIAPSQEHEFTRARALRDFDAGYRGDLASALAHASVVGQTL